MCEPTTILAVASLVGAGVAAYQGNQQKKATKAAASQAESNAQATAKQSELANNKANAKTPDTAALSAANVLAANGGQGSTMLTGAAGVTNDQLSLGKTTLLGA